MTEQALKRPIPSVAYLLDEQVRRARGGGAGRLPVLRPRAQLLGAVPTRLQRLPRRPRPLHDTVHRLRDAVDRVPRRPLPPAAGRQLDAAGGGRVLSSRHGAAVRPLPAVAGRRHAAGAARRRRVLLSGVLRGEPAAARRSRRRRRRRGTDVDDEATAQGARARKRHLVRLQLHVQHIGAHVRIQRHRMVSAANSF